MAVDARPCALLTQAADTVAAGSHDSVRLTVRERKVPADSIVEWLRLTARTYALDDPAPHPIPRPE